MCVRNIQILSSSTRPYTEMGYKVGPRLRESLLLVPSGREFTQPRASVPALHSDDDDFALVARGGTENNVSRKTS